MKRTALFALLLLSPAFVLADIQEIPPEEMTEAYIKDTTVIVRKQEQAKSTGNDKTTIRVTPLEQGFSEGESLSQQTPANGPVDTPDDYLSEHHETVLLQQSDYQFTAPGLDPLQLSREQALRSASGELQALNGETIDLNNPQFPSSIPSSINPPMGTDLSSTPGQFVISIPNNNNYANRSYTTPNGEYQIDITSDRIDFRLNIPQR